MVTETPIKLILRSKIDHDFSIEVGPRVIEACSILQHVATHTDNSAAIDVDMTQKQLEKFVELLNHFESPESPMDTEYTNAFFKQFSEEEFKDLCWRANFLDSQRFLEAAGQYALTKLDSMSVQEITHFLNIVNDYTPEEQQALENHPLEFFTNYNKNLNYLNNDQ